MNVCVCVRACVRACVCVCVCWGGRGVLPSPEPSTTVQGLLRCLDTPRPRPLITPSYPSAQSHALTSVRALKIPSTGILVYHCLDTRKFSSSHHTARSTLDDEMWLVALLAEELFQFVLGFNVLVLRPLVFSLRFNSVSFPVNMPDPIRIRSGSAWQHWPEAGRMIVAHWLASGPDPFGQNLTQSARTKSDPGWFCTVLSGTSVEERNRV